MSKKNLLIVITIMLFGIGGFAELPQLNQIMKGRDFVGNWVDGIAWAPDSGSFYFYCMNNEKRDIFNYNLKTGKIKEVKQKDFSMLPVSFYTYYQKLRSIDSSLPRKDNQILYANDGDLYLYHIKSHRIRQLTHTKIREENPFFGSQFDKIYFTSENNLFLWDLKTHLLKQLTYFYTAPEGKGEAPPQNKEAAEYYKKEESRLFDDFKIREDNKKEKDSGEKESKKQLTMTLKKGEGISNFYVTPDESHMVFMKYRFTDNTRKTLIPYYVTHDGYTKTEPSRAKAAEKGEYDAAFYIADLKTNEMRELEFPLENARFRNLSPSPKGNKFIVTAYSQDRKNAYILKFLLNSKKSEILYQVTDKAWIGYLSLSNMDWLDNNRIYFTSEEDGYSHIYIMDVNSKQKTRLTEGKYVVRDTLLSPDKRFIYFSANISHPGNRNLYKIAINSKKIIPVIPLKGWNDAAISPDFKKIAFRHSQANKPWELHIKLGEKQSTKIKDFVSAEFEKYRWDCPEVIRLKAKDGVPVYSRIYIPENPLPGKAGVIFIHGAGYLQNAHHGWSIYFREYMFNNKLREAGYYVMDVDYSGSAGYGADFRTRIYRHMGGKDLDDIVLAADYLKEKYGVNKVGIYGGSYGGFLTLMGLFTKPGTFTSGAALRPVTDWAHYSYWYSAYILNHPLEDGEAYRKSSPIYFAEGLSGHLLICHGMVDPNVHFQGSVRLVQRLIELGKENWELAVYPVEQHSFKRASSWTDEYKRIWKLFERTLK